MPPRNLAIFRRTPLLLLLTVSVSACDLIYPYEPPAVETPTQFIEKPADDVSAAWPTQHWWENYGSAELNTLVSQALAGNNDLAAAEARLRAADAQVRISGGALLPTLQADFSDTRTYTGNASTGVNTVGGVTTFGGSNPYRTTYNARLQAAYEIDFWGKNRSAAYAAEATRDAQQFDRDTLALSTSGSVVSVYFELLTTRERLSIAHNNLANAKKTLAALQRRFDAGLISRLDVAQQQTTVSQFEAAIPPLELSLSQNRDALAKLLGVLPEKLTLSPTTKLGDIKLPAIPSGLPSELLARRPDVARAEAQLVSQHANINAARAAFFPSISLTGSGGFVSRALETLILPESQLVALAGAVSQPIFQPGTLLGGLDLTKAQYDELLANYRQSIIASFADTEDALAGVRRGAEKVTAQTSLQRAARDAHALSKRQFEGGIVDITSVLATERSLYSAEDSTATARRDQLNATATLYQALGGGWSKPAAD
ncbi:MAG: efflux transporter outer membrane subunit [Rickettsiales bacterium]